MKRVIFPLILILFTAGLSYGQMPQIGVGAFGGMNLPMIQDDQGNGTAFGLKARVKLMPFMVVEPNVMFGKWGDPDAIDGVDLGISGSKVNAYGVDVTFGGLPGGVGIKPYGVIGAGIIQIKNDDTGYDESKLGFNAGLGFMISVMPMVDIDIRGKALIAPQEEGSKKAVILTGGLNYYFGIGM